MAVCRLLASVLQILHSRGDRGRKCRRTQDRLAMGAELDASRRARHPAGPIPSNGHPNRQHPLPLRHVSARGGSRRGDGRGAVGFRPQGLPARAKCSGNGIRSSTALLGGKTVCDSVCGLRFGGTGAGRSGRAAPAADPSRRATAPCSVCPAAAAPDAARALPTPAPPRPSCH